MSTVRHTPSKADRAVLHPSEAMLVAAILHAKKVVSRRLDSALRPIDMTFSRYEVLACLCAASGGSVATVELCRALHRHPTTIGSLIDRLEREGLITRSVPREDRRTTVITVTGPGREVWNTATGIIERLASRVDLELLRRLEIDMQQLVDEWGSGDDTDRRDGATTEPAGCEIRRVR